MMNDDNGKRIKQKIYRRNWIIATLFLLIVILLTPVVIPTKYYVENLGGAKSLKDVITINGKNDRHSGSLMYTAVSISGPSNLLNLGLASLNPHATIMDQKTVFNNQTPAENKKLDEYYMLDAQNTAVATAFKAAGEKVKLEYLGVYVLSIDAKSQFKSKLKVGDTIIKVDDLTVKNSQDFRNYLITKKRGQTVKITVKRGGKYLVEKGKLIKINSKRAGIGLVPIDHTKVITNKNVNFDLTNVGGPSAGLMFTLELYSILTGKDLTHGNKIAGTGTIEKDGSVGAIGGIDKKIVSADKAGAKYFIAPDDVITKEIKASNPNYINNYHEALNTKKKFNLKIKIIPVKNFSDALRVLERNQIPN